MDPRLRECIFNRIAINGFSVYPGETEGSYRLMVRGSEQTWPDSYIEIQESNNSFLVTGLSGRFRGHGAWILTCQNCGYVGPVSTTRGRKAPCPKCGSEKVNNKRMDIKKHHFQQNLNNWTISCKAGLP